MANPGVIDVISKGGGQVPEACHEVDQNELNNQDIQHSYRAHTDVQTIDPFFVSRGLTEYSKHLEHS